MRERNSTEEAMERRSELCVMNGLLVNQRRGEEFQEREKMVETSNVTDSQKNFLYRK